MGDNLVPLRPKNRRLNYKGLLKSFARSKIKRELEPVRNRELSLHPRLDGLTWYTARYIGPGEDFKELSVFSLRDLDVGPELLVYRVLRDLYGPADITTVALPEDSHKGVEPSPDQAVALPSEWAFMLKGASLAQFEIRRQPGTQDPHLAIWVPKLSEVDEAKKGAVQRDVELLLAELKKTLTQSRYLIEGRALKASSATLGPLNVYADMLAAGDEQLSAATRLKTHYKSALAKHEKHLPGPSLGTFYLGAAINYLLALEAFVNTLSEILRKDEFSAEVFDRATVRADFELRVLSLSLYCNGFERIPFSPDHRAFGHVKQLRSFRNNLLHGNLSRDDHVIHIIPEGSFLFYWWPAAEQRYAAERTPFDRLPLSRVLFSKSHAEAVRNHVEEIVDLIVAAMTVEFKSWVEQWRSQQFIPAYLKADRWAPNLKGLTKS